MPGPPSYQAYLPGGYDGGPPVEAVMRKGDVMFWHHWCGPRGLRIGLAPNL
jgi:hypothetical protein